ncbi:hypothetical protein [Neoroseomonas soli]|uniref:Uncharacterized protein n=1 Tax=Neoroseomonas soli TaxID=1081025 RepID=A0A9X9X3U5_9PROT|nr:hypothetical protein [Neoroseomonas soli]MBR0674074.1 hypothetical protein [Neoroseomonas soli]
MIAVPGLSAFSSLGILSVQALPVPVLRYATLEAPDPGTLLEFPSGGEALDVPVPVPFLPGMDEVEVAAATAALGSRPVERSTDHAGPAGSATVAALSFAPPVAGAPVSLLRVEIEGFSAGNVGVARTLLAPGLTLSWAAGSSTATPGALPGAEALHLLASPESGPPFLAAPAFPMPGAGGALYGDALGGCALSATRAADGTVRLVLTPDGGTPPLAAVNLTVVRLAADAPRLPNEGQPVPWRAQSIRAVWRLHPAALKVEAIGAGKAVTVAEMPGDPGRSSIGFDFAAALRGLARPAYDAARGAADLGLALRVTATGPGAARIRLDSTGLRYLRRPLPRPERLALRGAPAVLALTGASPGLRPEALELVLEGRFLPERLTDASDDAPPQARRGLVAEGATRLARRTTLTEAERALPLVRFAVFGRAAAPAELLLTLHAGDEKRVGPPLGPAASLALEPAEAPSWLLATLAAPVAPPLPPVVWVVAQVPRGRFLWHGTAADDDTALLSGDAGGSWTDAATRPALQLAVREAAATPLPLPLRWGAADQAGSISPDASGGAGPDFQRRLLLAEDTSPAALAAVAHAPLALSFACRRDVDLSVSAATFAYNPWTARS